MSIAAHALHQTNESGWAILAILAFIAAVLIARRLRNPGG